MAPTKLHQDLIKFQNSHIMRPWALMWSSIHQNNIYNLNKPVFVKIDKRIWYPIEDPSKSNVLKQKKVNTLITQKNVDPSK